MSLPEAGRRRTSASGMSVYLERLSITTDGWIVYVGNMFSAAGRSHLAFQEPPSARDASPEAVRGALLQRFARGNTLLEESRGRPLRGCQRAGRRDDGAAGPGGLRFLPISTTTAGMTSQIANGYITTGDDRDDL